MLYIVGGISRAGKSTLSRMILEKHNIPYMSLDSIFMGYQNTFPELIKGKGYTDFVRADIMWPFIKGAIDHILHMDQDYLIEGAFISPKNVNYLQQKFPEKIKACYIGYAEKDIEEKIEEIKRHNPPGDWLKGCSDEEIRNVVEVSKKFSSLVHKECTKYNIKWFDTSVDFFGTLELARRHLMEGK